MDLLASMPELTFEEQVRQLFYPLLGVTLVVKIFSTLYLKGVFGLGAQVRQLPGWDDEVENWMLWIWSVLGALLWGLTPGLVPTLSLIIGVYFVLGVLVWSLIRLMFHDLPRWLAWTLTVALILVPLISLIIKIVGGGIAGLLAGLLFLALELTSMGLIVALAIGAFKLTRALIRIGVDWFLGVPGAKDVVRRERMIQKYVPDGWGGPDAETDIKNPYTLAPNACILVDFFSSVLRDHLSKPDLRLVRAPVDVNLSVEVSNDRVNWESCTREQNNSGFEDYDVPYWNSPWRYIRICNNDQSRPVQVYDVMDLY